MSDTGTRAREPDERGYASAADGLRLYWEVHGGRSTTIVLLPPSPISHSGIWKAQVHYLARHYRVVAYDGRGNGNSDSPDPAGDWLDEWWASDCLAVMDATAHGYVHRLHRHLAACDIAISHGGLSTTMELTASARPFLYFPLRRHFEQNHHVAHRLLRYGAGRQMDFETDGPSEIAAAMAEEIDREPRYRLVDQRGAGRAAQAISELL